MEQFVCRKCGNCCRIPGEVVLTAPEAEKIAAFLGIELPVFMDKYVRLSSDRRQLVLIGQEDAPCIFLIPEGKNFICRINPVKPAQCRNFPEHWNYPGWESVCARRKEKNMITHGGDLVVISGPSGVGKSTLIGKLREKFPDLTFSVSCTTRPMRPGEQNGREYYFLTPEEFEARSQNDEFIEQAHIFSNRYGTLKSEVVRQLREGKRVLLDIDLQGAKSIRRAAEKDPEIAAAAVFIMIAPPSLEVLEKRLRSRNSDSVEQIKLRLASAQKELCGFRTYDYLVVNDDLETAANELTQILSAARCRCQTIKENPFL